MRTRLMIFDSTGKALIGMDSGSGGEHAVAFVRDNLALLATLSHTDCVVVEYDPPQGGDAANIDIREMASTRAELRQRPDGKTELIGVYRRDNRRSIARTLRVVHAPASVANARASIRVANTRETLPATAQAARAQRQAEASR